MLAAIISASAVGLVPNGAALAAPFAKHERDLPQSARSDEMLRRWWLRDAIIQQTASSRRLPACLAQPSK